MALFHYLRPVGDNSHGSVSQSIPHGVRAEVNKEIARSVEKRGETPKTGIVSFGICGEGAGSDLC